MTRAAASLAAGRTSLRMAGLKVSHPDRVVDPATGLTKLDLVRYYSAVAECMLPHLKGRPVAEVRGPQGLRGPLFFQRHDGHADDGEAPLKIATKAALLAAAQLNVIEFHTGNAGLGSPDRPDRIVFDLDPGEGTPWQQVQHGAQQVRDVLQALGLRAWLKTSGGKGLHVVVPIARRWSVDAVKAFSKAVVERLVHEQPEHFVAKSGPRNRVGRIFIDYLRNGSTATTVAAFSARARPGLGVSMPVGWDQLPELTGGAHWTVLTAADHVLAQAPDPWAGYGACRQSLTAPARALGLEFAPTASSRA